jgi:Helix-turn-helix domain
MFNESEEKLMDAGLMSVVETAAFLHMKESTIRSWVLKRRIPYVKLLHGRVFIRKADALALVEQSLVLAEHSPGQQEGEVEATTRGDKTHGRQ